MVADCTFQDRRALLLATNAKCAAIDKKMLAQLACRNIVTANSCSHATEILQSGYAPDFIALGWHLGEMDGPSFIKHLRSTVRDRLIPCIMVTHRNTKDDVLLAIAAGCSGFIIRPYSFQTFEKHIALALESSGLDELETEQLDTAKQLFEAGQFQEAVEEYQVLTSVANDAERYFNLGLRSLAKGEFGKAIVAFNKALKLNAMYAEAFKGLADAHRAMGDIDSCEQYLKKAAKIFADQDRHQDVKNIFAEIIQLDPNATNPYNNLGVQLRKAGNFEAALHAYTQAAEISPNDENLHFNMAKAYLCKGDTEKALEHLGKSLGINPQFELASQLFRKLRKSD